MYECPYQILIIINNIHISCLQQQTILSTRIFDLRHTFSVIIAVLICCTWSHPQSQLKYIAIIYKGQPINMKQTIFILAMSIFPVTAFSESTLISPMIGGIDICHVCNQKWNYQYI